MCGRFNQTASGEEIAEAFSLDAAPLLAPRYNIAPTQPVAVVLLEPGGRRVLAERKWGLVPRDALSKERGFINARAESAAAKPAFAEAFAARRCLVPATGFYEWRLLDSRRRQPWLFRLASGAPFAFAGLWEPAPVAIPDAVPSCTILTTQPNELTRPVHDRMPVILEPADYTRWLDPALRAPYELRALLRPLPADGMTAYPVSDRVNNAGFDDAGCIAPA